MKLNATPFSRLLPTTCWLCHSSATITGRRKKLVYQYHMYEVLPHSAFLHSPVSQWFYSGPRACVDKLWVVILVRPYAWSVPDKEPDRWNLNSWWTYTILGTCAHQDKLFLWGFERCARTKLEQMPRATCILACTIVCCCRPFVTINCVDLDTGARSP